MLPIVLNPSRVTIVVFGYGKASQMKIKGIARAGITCYVISPEITGRTEGGQRIILEAGAYDPAHLDKGQLVIAATGSVSLNKKIIADARAKGKLVLSLSDGDQSDFHMMSWRKNGPVTVGLSTGNCAPKESKRLIESIMEIIDDETVERIAVLGQLRKKIKQLGYAPIKPVINKLTDESLERLIELNALSLETLAEEIKKR